MKQDKSRLLFILSFLFLILLFPYFSKGQATIKRQKFWSFGFNVGMIGWSPSTLHNINGSNYFQRTTNYGFGEVIDEHGNKSLALIANTSIGAHAGFLWHDKKSNNYTAIDLELQGNKACYEFDSPFGFPSHGDTTTKWIEADKYIKYSLALQRCWYRGENILLGGASYWYVRESFGQTLLHRNLGNPFSDLLKENHTEDWTENGTGMKSNIVSVNQNSWMLGTEIGIKYFSEDNKHCLDLGLVYYAPFANTFTEEYEFFQKNVSVGKSQITYNGGTIMLNMRYSINYKIKDKPIDTTAIKKKEDLVHTHKINGRHLDVQKTMTADNDLVTVRVWDRGQVDGDKISLYLNGELVLDDFTLSKDKKEVTLHLVAGANYLVMHAINLGTIPPNTAAIEIDDGSKKKRNFTIVSDTGKSGAIEIIYNP